MSLLGARLELWDVHDVEALARRILSGRLHAWGAHLDLIDYEDALAHLIAIAWELSCRYDPAKGLSFSTYAEPILRLRIVDWYRKRFEGSRYGRRELPLSLDERDGLRRERRPVDAALVERAEDPSRDRPSARARHLPA